MALRAGYYGLKNSVKKKLEKLAADMAGAKIIKSFGDGLNLTSTGKLNLTAATASKIGGVKVGEGLNISDGGVLSSDGSGYQYSTTKFDTGLKWTNGSTVYGLVIENFIIGYASYANVVDLGVKVLCVLDYDVFGIAGGQSGISLVPKSNFMQVDNTHDTTKIAVSTAQSGTNGSCTLIVYFVEEETEE